jgi:hypothetical protein
MPHILNEEAALKTLLSGLTVEDSGNPTRPVGVFYGQPDPQIRLQAYPYITIDLISVAEEKSRAHRGYGTLKYAPEGSDSTVPYATSYPIPVSLTYQITTYARNPRHDRQLINLILSPARIPFRFGTLTIPEDRTVRRLDMLGFIKRDTTEEGKRLLSTAFNVQVSAEFLPTTLTQLYEVLDPPHITTNSTVPNGTTYN